MMYGGVRDVEESSIVVWRVWERRYRENGLASPGLCGSRLHVSVRTWGPSLPPTATDLTTIIKVTRSNIYSSQVSVPSDV